MDYELIGRHTVAAEAFKAALRERGMAASQLARMLRPVAEGSAQGWPAVDLDAQAMLEMAAAVSRQHDLLLQAQETANALAAQVGAAPLALR